MSLYADDATVFISPTLYDVTVTRHILQVFGEANDLITNLEKTEFLPIRCQGLNIQEIIGANQNISQFACSYLGFPLHFKKFPRNAIQPMVQKIGNGWKHNLLTYLGWELLVKTVLSAIPTHFLTVHNLPRWVTQDIDHFWRSFLWRGETPDRIKGEHCLVKWKVCTCPRKWGGLGIKYLNKFGRALRLRSLWH
jgi:hypothetical protein